MKTDNGGEKLSRNVDVWRSAFLHWYIGGLLLFYDQHNPVSERFVAFLDATLQASMPTHGGRRESVLTPTHDLVLPMPPNETTLRSKPPSIASSIASTNDMDDCVTDAQGIIKVKKRRRNPQGSQNSEGTIITSSSSMHGLTLVVKPRGSTKKISKLIALKLNETL